jgi:hypothetical protein
VTIADFLEHIQRESEYRGQIRHIETIPAREASYGALSSPLADTLSSASIGSTRIKWRPSTSLRQATTSS